MSVAAATVPLVGAQRPRVMARPPSVSSTGAEAADLAASAGLHLYPWQRLVLDVALAEDAAGKWAAFEVACMVPRQNGKGDQALDTPVLTTRGWSTMGELTPGDFVYGSDGRPTRVVAVSPVYTDSDCYAVEFTDGSKVVSGGDHLWTVHDIYTGKRTTVPTRAIAATVGGTRADTGRRWFRYRVDCDAAIDRPDADLPIDPWLLGFWLGDGTRGAASLTVGHEDLGWVQRRLAALGATSTASLKDHGKAWTVRFSLDAKARQGFQAQAQRLGIWKDKRIPEVYQLASARQRRALLAGLMDSDGIGGHNKTPQAEFCTVLPGLADDFMQLLRGLGVRVSKVRRTTSASGRGRWRFLWTPTFNPFQLPRKAERWASPMSQRHRRMSITAVRPVPTVPTRCIQVANPDGIYLVGRLFTPTHNSTIEALMLADLFLLDTPLSIYSAHLFTTTTETMARIMALIEGSDHLSRRVARVRRSTGAEAIEMRSGARLRFLARSSSSGRGFTAGRLYLDEAQILGSQAMAAIIPTLTTAPNPQLLYFGTAPLPESDYWRGLRARGGLPDDKRGRLAYLEWSAPPDADPADRGVWAQANPSLGHNITEAYIADEFHALPAVEFARERLGIVPEGESGSAIQPRVWDAAQDPASVIPDAAPVVFAVDVSPGGKSAAIAVAGTRADGARHVELVDHRPGSDWVTSEVTRLAAEWGGQVVADPAGPAGPVVVALQAAGVRVRVTSGRDVQAAAGGLVAGLESGQVAVRPARALDVAAEAARARPVGDGAWTWTRRDTSMDIAPLVAVSLALWGLTVEPDYDLLDSIL